MRAALKKDRDYDLLLLDLELKEGGGFDLLAEGQERFVSKTAKLRAHANALGIRLCHEIHPGTGASWIISP